MMPGLDFAPTFGLLTEFNARSWSGVTVFTHGGHAVAMPAFSAGEGLYDDGLSFLNGRGSITGVNLKYQTSTLANFGIWDVSLLSSDRIKFTCDEAFNLTSSSSTLFPFGFNDSIYNSAFDAGQFSVTADLNWVRGAYRGERLTITQTASPYNTFKTPNAQSHTQDIIVLMRDRGAEGDADDIYSTTCLEYLHKIHVANPNLRWLINDEGKCEVRYLTSIGSLVWSSTTFRDRLGFTGSESVVASGTWSVITADNYMGGVLIPSRPVENHHMKIQQVTSSRRKLGGGYTSNMLGSYNQSSIRFHLDASADQRDLYRHYTDHFIKYVGEGERINFYQQWGDSRRSLITASINTSQPAYDLLYTSEMNGERGRIRGSMISGQTYDLVYPTRIKKRVPIIITIEHLS